MKKILPLSIFFIFLLAQLAFATQTVSYSETYTNESGLKTLAQKSCGGGVSAVDWTTVSWTDSSANTTACEDSMRCKSSDNRNDWSSYTAWKDSAESVAISGTWVECQWNLTSGDAGATNCTVSGATIKCGGFGNAYSATDAPVVFIDFLVEIVAMLVLVGAFFAMGLIYVLWKKKGATRL